MLTCKDAADRIVAANVSVTPETVAKLARRGAFPDATKVDGKWTIPPASVEAYIAARRRARSDLSRLLKRITVGATFAFFIGVAGLVSGITDALTFIRGSGAPTQAAQPTAAVGSVVAVSPQNILVNLSEANLAAARTSLPTPTSAPSAAKESTDRVAFVSEDARLGRSGSDSLASDIRFTIYNNSPEAIVVYNFQTVIYHADGISWAEGGNSRQDVTITPDKPFILDNRTFVIEPKGRTSFVLHYVAAVNSTTVDGAIIGVVAYYHSPSGELYKLRSPQLYYLDMEDPALLTFGDRTMGDVAERLADKYGAWLGLTNDSKAYLDALGVYRDNLEYALTRHREF